MDGEAKRRLVVALEAWLTDVDRHAGCSDAFFRQVYTARARGFLATGLLDALKAEATEDAKVTSEGGEVT